MSHIVGDASPTYMWVGKSRKQLCPLCHEWFFNSLRDDLYACGKCKMRAREEHDVVQQAAQDAMRHAQELTDDDITSVTTDEERHRFFHWFHKWDTFDPKYTPVNVGKAEATKAEVVPIREDVVLDLTDDG